MNPIKLTLSCPRLLAEQVTETLLESTLVTGGFTTLEAGGHGADFAAASLREKVRGRVDTELVILVLPAANAAALLDELRRRFPTPQMHYWTEPVLDFGDFA
jgi:hypothetical protein